MHKILVPTISFQDVCPDEKRIELAYARVIEMAFRDLVAKKGLTSPLSSMYTKVQYERTVPDDRGGSQSNEG